MTPVAAVAGQSITTLGGSSGPLGGAVGRDECCCAGAASAAAGVDRCPGAALRLLPERHDDPGGRPARDDEEPVRGSDPHGDERASLPLRHLSENPDRDPEGRGRDGKGRCVMTGLLHEKEFSRKAFIKGGGALVVGFGARRRTRRRRPAEGAPANDPVRQHRTRTTSCQTAVGRLVARDHTDNTVIVTHGETELGHGTPTGILMLVAEELNIRHGSDDGMRTRRHWLNATGGGGGSGGISSRLDRRPAPRRACANQVLLGLASTQLGRSGRGPQRRNGVDLGRGQAGHLRRADRREALQLRSWPLDAWSAGASATATEFHPGHRQHEAGQPVHARRHRWSADRHSGEGRRGPTPTSRTSACRGWSTGAASVRAARVRTPREHEPTQRRPDLDRPHPRGADRPDRQFPRRRRPEGVRRDPGRRAAEGGLEDDPSSPSARATTGRGSARLATPTPSTRPAGSPIEVVPAAMASAAKKVSATYRTTTTLRADRAALRDRRVHVGDIRNAIYSARDGPG